MTHPHIVKRYDDELTSLANGVAAMGDFANAQFGVATSTRCAAICPR